MWYTDGMQRLAPARGAINSGRGGDGARGRGRVPPGRRRTGAPGARGHAPATAGPARPAATHGLRPRARARVGPATSLSWW